MIPNLVGALLGCVQLALIGVFPMKVKARWGGEGGADHRLRGLGRLRGDQSNMRMCGGGVGNRAEPSGGAEGGDVVTEMKRIHHEDGC